MLLSFVKTNNAQNMLLSFVKTNNTQNMLYLLENQ